MRALVWKELRENFKWALLAMAVLGGAEYYALYQTSGGQQDYYYNDGVTLCRTSFLTVTTFGCAIAGFFLGLIQILPELKRDRWAALLHRPVSRGTIFWGKAVAGLLLYAMAAIPPFLFSVWQAATPGHFGVPFLPEMARPGIADLCMGAVYYFAALTLALQRGGWIGLRVFPLLAAMHASYFVLDSKLFYVAVEAAALMALALLFAAWGAIHNQESLRGRPWLGKAAFLAVVFYGVCGLGDLAQSFLHAATTTREPKSMSYQLSNEGVPVLLTNVDNILVSVRDLDGKPFANPDYQPERIRNHLSYPNTFSQYVGNSHGWHPRKRQNDYRQSQSYLEVNDPYRHPRLEQWFYLVRQRSLVGFQPDQKAPIGRLDWLGFQPISTQPEGFPHEAGFRNFDQDTYCLWDSGSLRLAYLAKRKIVDLPLPAPGPIYGVGGAWNSSGRGPLFIMGVVLADGMAVYDDNARQIAMLPYHHDIDRWGKLALNKKGDRFYLWYKPSAWIGGKVQKTMPSYLEEMNSQGEILHSYTLPPLPDFPRSASWPQFLDQRLQSPAFFFGTMGYRKIGAELGSTRLKNELARQFGAGWRLTRETALSIATLSLVLAGITHFQARRAHFSRPRAWAWTGLVFAFNLAGFITFLLAADWPRVVPCPGCRRKRPIDSESCPHCGKEWPVPQPTGTEIFNQWPAGALAAKKPVSLEQ